MAAAMLFWSRCRLMILALLAASAAAQTPPNPLALATAMRAEAPLSAGRTMTVTDGRTGAPLAGASLVLLGYSDFLPELGDAMQVLRRHYAADPVMASLAEAVRFGRKWATDSAGRAVIPADFRGYLHIVLGDLHDMTAVAESYESQLTAYPRTWVAAQVVHADGAPAAGIEFGLRHGTNEVHQTGVTIRASTDARGSLRLELPQYTMRESWAYPLVLQAAVCGADDRTGVSFDPARWRRGDPGALRLQLPAVGQLRVSAVDLDGRPRPVAYVDVSCADGPHDQVRGRVRSDPTPEVLVATKRDYHVSLRFGNQVGSEQRVVAGPRLAGEVVDVVVDARTSPHVLAVQLLLPDGRPLDRGEVWCGELFQFVVPDGTGRIRVAPTPAQAASLTQLTCSVQHKGRSLGGVAVPVQKRAGLQDLGRATLAEEPVLVAGRVLDTQGRPVAGAYVRRRFANHVCDHPVPAITDAQGRFMLRLLNPGSPQVWVAAGHPQAGLWPPRPLALSEVPGFDVGATDVEIVLEPVPK